LNIFRNTLRQYVKGYIYEIPLNTNGKATVGKRTPEKKSIGESIKLNRKEASLVNKNIEFKKTPQTTADINRTIKDRKLLKINKKSIFSDKNNKYTKNTKNIHTFSNTVLIALPYNMVSLFAGL